MIDQITVPHYPYDLIIHIENSSISPVGPIYLFLSIELCTLQNFIEENIKVSLIWPSRLPYRALVLFVKKKDKSLYLYIDYQGLNKIT